MSIQIRSVLLLTHANSGEHLHSLPILRLITRGNWTSGDVVDVQSEWRKKATLHFCINCLETQSQGLPKSGFSSVGKLNFRDIFAGKKRTSLFTNTSKLTHGAMQSQGASWLCTRRKRIKIIVFLTKRGIKTKDFGGARAKCLYIGTKRQPCTHRRACCDRQNTKGNLRVQSGLKERTGQKEHGHSGPSCQESMQQKQGSQKK